MKHGLFTNSLARSLGFIAGLGVGLGLAAGAALGQGYDIDWVTIGDVGNPAYENQFGGIVDGRGSVGYEYRIGRYEVTTSQWMEFVNTFSTQSDELRNFGRPSYWGATPDGSYDGPGIRWKLNNAIEHAELLPVHGIDWREAAMLANWLHNNKSSDLSAIENGAYDTSTFTRNNDGSFNDQLTRSPDARFWIPSLDEWAKAVHYDPDRFGFGQGGWWEQPNGTDTELLPGLPGRGQTSASLEDAGLNIPLGAYLDVQSPWGLFDVSGGTLEWTEEATNDRQFRWADGAPTRAGEDFLLVDRADQMADGRPWIGGLRYGIRLAAAVPAPGTSLLLALTLPYLLRRQR